MQRSQYSYLDNIRINNGIDKCKAVFNEVLYTNKSRAVALLNDKRITFVCLFIFLPEIETFDLYRNLNSKNITALKITDQILNFNGNLFSVKSKNVYSVIKWIFDTGFSEDGLNNDYEQVLDTAAAVLINTYKDTNILPAAADMIFKRNKRGAYTHDLMWSFFQIRHPYTLKLIAERIRSSDKEDAELACKLLNINSISDDNQKQYEDYLQWLKENDPFLYFTGENLQFSSHPVFCKVDLERKYLVRGIPTYSRQPYYPVNDIEKRCLEAFKQLNDEEKTVLSDYSYKIHNQNISKWQEWLQYPIDKQINSVKNGSEVFV